MAKAESEKKQAEVIEISGRFLKLGEVQRLTGQARSSVYRRIASGAFPRPVALSPGCVRWPEDEVRGWMAALPRAGNDNNVKQARAAA
jgi:predicted DNA-binding transcriptional regulator AlpA